MCLTLWVVVLSALLGVRRSGGVLMNVQGNGLLAKFAHAKIVSQQTGWCGGCAHRT